MPDVRPARPTDAAGICRVCARGWRDAYRDLLPERYVEANVSKWYRPERVERRIRDREARWLVAVEEGEVVGAGQGTVDEGAGELLVLYVDPDAQRRGHGARLLAAITDRHRERGASEQFVDVFEGNEPGLSFYRKRGFEWVAAHETNTVDGVDPNHRTLRLRRRL